MYRGLHGREFKQRYFLIFRQLRFSKFINKQLSTTPIYLQKILSFDGEKFQANTHWHQTTAIPNTSDVDSTQASALVPIQRKTNARTSDVVSTHAPRRICSSWSCAPNWSFRPLSISFGKVVAQACSLKKEAANHSNHLYYAWAVWGRQRRCRHHASTSAPLRIACRFLIEVKHLLRILKFNSLQQ